MAEVALALAVAPRGAPKAAPQTPAQAPDHQLQPRQEHHHCHDLVRSLAQSALQQRRQAAQHARLQRLRHHPQHQKCSKKQGQRRALALPLRAEQCQPHREMNSKPQHLQRWQRPEEQQGRLNHSRENPSQLQIASLRPPRSHPPALAHGHHQHHGLPRLSHHHRWCQQTPLVAQKAHQQKAKNPSMLARPRHQQRLCQHHECYAASQLRPPRVLTASRVAAQQKVAVRASRHLLTGLWVRPARQGIQPTHFVQAHHAAEASAVAAADVPLAPAVAPRGVPKAAPQAPAQALDHQLQPRTRQQHHHCRAGAPSREAGAREAGVREAGAREAGAHELLQQTSAVQIIGGSENIWNFRISEFQNFHFVRRTPSKSRDCAKARNATSGSAEI